jgi:glycosyltransferase involved in cell wall biosynthesis
VGSPIAKVAHHEGLPVYLLPGHLDWDIRNIIALKRILRVGVFDVLHTNDAHSASLGAVMKFFAPGIKLVHTRRVSYALKRGWSAKKYRMADAVAAVSCDVAKTLAQGGLDQERIETIHSGIRPRDYKQREGKKREEALFGLIGAFTPQKGVEVFLKALARVREIRPELKWLGLVIGDGPLAHELEDLAVDLGIDDAVSFPGFRESREVLCEFDVLAVPSMHGEGSSATIKEGWAARVPVVCSDLSANLELVENDENGLVTPRGDDLALAMAMVSLIEDENLAKRLVSRGAERVKNFTVRRMAEAYRDLYKQLVK